MATPTVVGGSDGTVGTSGTSRVAWTTAPTHQADDIILVMGCVKAASNLSCATAGWTTIYAENDADLSTILVWKRATSSAESSPTITSSTTLTTSAGLYNIAVVIRGCVTSGDPYEFQNGAVASTSTNPDPTDITVAGGVNYLLMAWVWIGIQSPTITGYPPTGWNNTNGRNTSTASGGGYNIKDYYKSAGNVSGLQTVPSIGMAASNRNKTWAIAMRDAIPDTTPPVTNISSGPSRTKISAQTGFDSTDISYTVDEACQAWKVKVVPATNSTHDQGTQIEAGGAVAAGGTINVNITNAELAAASAGDGAKIVKMFVQDNAGNWSTA